MAPCLAASEPSATTGQPSIIYLLLWLLAMRVPLIFISPTVDVWWASCQSAVMTGAAWVLYTWFARDWDRRYFKFATGENGMRIARALFGLALIPFGVAHFIYLKVTADLVPGLVASPCGLGVFHGLYLHRGRLGDRDRYLRETGGHAGDAADGSIHTLGVDPDLGGGRERVPMG